MATVEVVSATTALPEETTEKTIKVEETITQEEVVTSPSEAPPAEQPEDSEEQKQEEEAAPVATPEETAAPESTESPVETKEEVVEEEKVVTEETTVEKTEEESSEVVQEPVLNETKQNTEPEELPAPASTEEAKQETEPTAEPEAPKEEAEKEEEKKAKMETLFTNSTVPRGRDDVYVAAVPLRATKGPPQLLMSIAYSFSFWDLQHFMVIISPSSPPADSQALVFDFQPRDPEDISTALTALSGRAIPGIVLERKLRKRPRSKCWYVGSSEQNAVDVAYEFNRSWDTNLRVGHHDCRDYTNGLVEDLTGEKNVLKRLSRSF